MLFLKPTGCENWSEPMVFAHAISIFFMCHVSLVLYDKEFQTAIKITCLTYAPVFIYLKITDCITRKHAQFRISQTNKLRHVGITSKEPQSSCWTIRGYRPRRVHFMTQPTKGIYLEISLIIR